MITREVEIGKVSIYRNGNVLYSLTRYEEKGNKMNCEGFVLGND